ncbi:hypothetical protein EIN_499050, partial [Entamoeba invadens IP1]
MQEKSVPTNENGVLLVSSEDIPRTLKQRKKNWKCVFPNCNEPLKTRFNCYAHVWDSHLRAYYTQNFPNMYPVTAFKKTADKNPMKVLAEKYMIQLVEKPPSKQRIETDQKQKIQIQNTTQNENNVLNTTNNPIETNGTTQTYNNITNPCETQVNNTQTPISVKQEEHHTSSLNETEQNLSDLSGTTPFVPDNQNYPFAFLNGFKQLNYSQPTFIQQYPQQCTVAVEQQNWDQQQNVNVQTAQQPQNSDDFIKIEQISEQLKRLHVYGEIFAENGYLVRSDARTKTDITRIEDALSSVTGLVGRKYAYKTDPTKVKCGFVAQEMQEVLPDLVQKDADGNLSVDYLGVVPYIVEALKTIHQNTLELQSNAKTEYNDLS